MNAKNLLAAVRRIVDENPLWSTRDIFDELRLEFKKESPEWLMNQISHYRSKILRGRKPKC